MSYIEDSNYDDIFWGYASNEKEFVDFLLSLWNKNVVGNDEIKFYNTMRAKFPIGFSHELDRPGEYIKYPSPTETDKYTIGKKPKGNEYPVVILYEVDVEAINRDKVFTWVSLNRLRKE